MSKVLKERLKILVAKAASADPMATSRSISMEATGKPDTIRDILRNKVKSPRGDTLQKLADYFGVGVAYLTGASNGSSQNRQSSDITAARVIGFAQAGPFMPIDDTSYEDDPRWIPSVADPDFPNLEQIAFEVKGDSIDLVCPDGGYAICLIFADTGAAIADGKWVVVDRIRGELRERTLKQVRVVGPGRYELHPASRNKRHKPITFPSAEPEETVQVFALVRRFISPLLR